MKARGVLLLLLVAVAAVLALPAAHAVTATVSDTGWWTKRIGASAQPDKGFEVAAGAQGQESIAALRVDVSGGSVSGAILVLDESGGLLSDTAVINVCTTAEAWQAANPGAYADAPEPLCGGAVALERDAAAGTWRADVTFLLGDAASGGTASLMLVPVLPSSDLPVAAPYQVQFSGAHLDTTGSDAGAAPTTATTFAPPTTSPLGDLFSPTGPAATDFSSSFNVPSLPPATIVGSPAAPVSPVAPTAGPAFNVPQHRSDGGGDGKPWGRLIWMVPLSALVGAGATYGRRNVFSAGEVT